MNEVDRLFQNGGGYEIPESLEKYLAPDGFERKLVLDEAVAYKENGLRQEGSTTVTGFELVYLEPKGDNPVLVDWDICLDQSRASIEQEGGRPTQLERKSQLVEMKRNQSSGQWQVVVFKEGTNGIVCEN